MADKCLYCEAEGTIYKSYSGIGEQLDYMHTACCKCKKDWKEKDGSKL